MMNINDARFSGIGRLYGQEALARFHAARVLVIGIGGVGTWVTEALARSAIGTLILVDLDDICVTNTNRQIHALEGNYGQPKITAMAARIRAISPECELIEHHGFYTEKSAASIFEYAPTLVVDAIDAVKPKCHLLATCYRQKIPIVTCGGAGGRVDAMAVRCDDLAKSYGDALLSQVRRQLRIEYGLPLGGKSKKKLRIPCIFSPEQPVFPTCSGNIATHKDPAYAEGRMSCEAGFGSATHMTGIFGFMMVSVVLKKLKELPLENKPRCCE